MTRKQLVALVLGLLLLLGVGGAIVLTRDGGSDDAAGSTERGNREGQPGRGSSPTVPSPEGSAPVSDDQTTVTILAPTDLGTVVGTLADLYGELNPDVTVQLVTGESADLLQRVQDGEQASIYIDNASVVRRLDQERYEGEPARFGSDLYRILVAKGNPKGVSDLGVFGTDPNTTSGMCAVEAPCGLAAARILERGGVVGTPDQYQPSDQQLVEQVAAGELDAAIVRRSTARIRFGKSSAVRIDPQHNQRIQYDIVALRDAPPVAGFVEFVETHEGARKILKNRGYLSFYDRN